MRAAWFLALLTVFVFLVPRSAVAAPSAIFTKTDGTTIDYTEDFLEGRPGHSVVQSISESGTLRFSDDRDWYIRLTVKEGDLTVEGFAGQSPVLTGGEFDWLFEVMGGASLTLDGLTLRDGQRPSWASRGQLDQEMGGAVLVVGGTLIVKECAFAENFGDDGGAIAALDGSTVTIADSTFENNVASSGNGGALYVDASVVNVSNSTFEGNTLRDDWGFGEAIYVADDASDLTVVDSTFVGDDVNVMGSSYPYGGPVSFDCGGGSCMAGRVQFLSADGSLTDLTETFEAGTAEAPVKHTLAEDGWLYFPSGTWYVQLVVKGRADVGVIGTMGRDVTLLSGGGTQRVVRVEDATLSLDRLTLQDGFAKQGAGVFGGTDATISIRDCTIKDSTADRGGGLYLGAGTTVELKQVTVEGNTGKSSGSGVLLNASDAVLQGYEVTFVDNDLDFGGTPFSFGDNERFRCEDGVCSLQGVRWTATDGTVTDLTTTLGAGTSGSPAAHTVDTDGTLAFYPGTWYVDVTITGGSAVSVEGIESEDDPVLSGGSATRMLTVLEGSAVTVTGMTLKDGDRPTGYGGAIALRDASTLVATDVTFEGNDAAHGGAIGIRQGSQATLSDVVFENNASVEGEAAWVDSDATLQAVTSFFQSETVYALSPHKNPFGGVFFQSTAWDEPSIVCELGTCRYDGVSFTSNNGKVADLTETSRGDYGQPVEITLSESGTLRLGSAETWYLQLIVEEGAEVTVTGFDNQPTPIIDGSWMYWIVRVDGASLTLDGVQLQNAWAEKATEQGGAITVEAGTLVVKNSTLTDNAGRTGGAIAAVGGSTVTVQNTTVTEGSALEGKGAALYISESTVTVEDSTFADNDDYWSTRVADDAEAISLADSDSSLTVTNTTLDGDEVNVAGTGRTYTDPATFSCGDGACADQD